MVMNHEIIIFTPIFGVLIGFIAFRILKKKEDDKGKKEVRAGS